MAPLAEVLGHGQSTSPAGGEQTSSVGVTRPWRNRFESPEDATDVSRVRPRCASAGVPWSAVAGRVRLREAKPCLTPDLPGGLRCLP